MGHIFHAHQTDHGIGIAVGVEIADIVTDALPDEGVAVIGLIAPGVEGIVWLTHLNAVEAQGSGSCIPAHGINPDGAVLVEGDIFVIGQAGEEEGGQIVFLRAGVNGFRNGGEASHWSDGGEGFRVEVAGEECVHAAHGEAGEVDPGTIDVVSLQCLLDDLHDTVHRDALALNVVEIVGGH